MVIDMRIDKVCDKGDIRECIDESICEILNIEKEILCHIKDVVCDISEHIKSIDSTDDKVRVLNDIVSIYCIKEKSFVTVMDSIENLRSTEKFISNICSKKF